MSLRDKIKVKTSISSKANLYLKFGVITNPFPSSTQTSSGLHCKTLEDDEVESRVASFVGDLKTQVVVIEGTQGTGKTNFLKFFETEIANALSESEGGYLIRYLADPEASFEGTIRYIFLELGMDHLRKLVLKLREKPELLKIVHGLDMRAALRSLMDARDEDDRAGLMMDWLLGLRLLKRHRDHLNVQFRLDTMESKTAALRDLVRLSSEAGLLKGIFLLLDELEKQDGVLGPAGIVRYLSAMRAVIDALPRHLFMMIAVTPDAMRRYATALPALRSRLQDQVTLKPLTTIDEAKALARFYVDAARRQAHRGPGSKAGTDDLVSDAQIEETFSALLGSAARMGDAGVRHREFLHHLRRLAEQTMQAAG